MERIIDLIIPIAKSLAAAIAVLVIGLFIIKRLAVRLEKVMARATVDDNLKPFLVSLLNIGLRVILILMIIGILGIDTSAFIAVLASLGFAIGLAFQGSISNFAGGVLLLVTKPFKVGDIIETNDVLGIVVGIKILYTEINTFDNKTIFIPNGGLANSAITNFTKNENRRVDLKFNVGYDSNIDKVKELLLKIIDKHELIFKEPEPFIKLFEHGSSELVFIVRVWCRTEDYWHIYYDLLEQVKKEFDKAKISIPYPQMDVHIKGGK